MDTPEWADDLTGKLERIADRTNEDIETKDALKEALFEPLSISGGEEFSAEEHRGREILELLQNARDAVRADDADATTPSRRVGERAIYILITDEGLLIANTGDRFDFNESDVRNSLRILGHSEKSDDEIGNFGVGLTSIRAIGESYEVWSKQDPTTGPQSGSASYDDWRVVCSPRNTIGAIARPRYNALDESAQQTYDAFADDIRSDAWTHPDGELPLPEGFLDTDQLPYFTYPVAMEGWASKYDIDAADMRRRRASQLLRGEVPEPSGAQHCDPTQTLEQLIDTVGMFTTAVFVDYEDDIWRDLYRCLSGGQRIDAADSEQAAHLTKQAWFGGQNTDEHGSELTPELLLNLGGIDHVVVERAHSNGTDLQQWKVYGQQRSGAHTETSRHRFEDSTQAGNVEATQVHVDLTTQTATDRRTEPPNEEYSFWHFQFERGQTYPDVYEQFDLPGSANDGEADADADAPIDVSLLVPAEPAPDTSYHPHLYYPISRADQEQQFPFCLHGDFVVRQNRQSLAGTSFARNCAVSAEAARLVGRVGEVIASTRFGKLPNAAPLQQAAPWCLLPAADSGLPWRGIADLAEHSVNQVGNNAPFDALRAEVYRQLRRRRCLSVIGTEEQSQVTVASVDTDENPLLHSEPVAMGAVAVLFAIDEQISSDSPTTPVTTAATATTCAIPTWESLQSLLTWLTHDESDDRERSQREQFALLRSDDHSTWAPRLRVFVDGVETTVDSEEADVDESVTADQFEGWCELLQQWSQQIRNVEDSTTDSAAALQDIDWDAGHLLFEGTFVFANDEPARLNDLASTDNSRSPYLLPCFAAGETVDESDSMQTVQLVTVESHRTDGSSASGHTENERQVLRPDDTKPASSVPPGVDFNIYYLTKPARRTAVAETDWGTRTYGGQTDLYWTLLKDVGDRLEVVSRSELEYLAEQFDQVTSNANALKAQEGSYHDKDDISSLVSARSSASDDVPLRNEARRTQLDAELLTVDKAREARTLQFTSPARSTWLSDPDAEDESRETIPETDPLIQESERQPAVDVDDAQLVPQLGLLGVTLLPGVRVITSSKDLAHPRHDDVWDPREWSKWKQGVAGVPDRVQDLRDVLTAETAHADESAQYLELLTTPTYGPGRSATHSPECDVKEFPQKSRSPDEELAGYDVHLGSWVWLDTSELASLTAPHLASILRHSGTSLSETVLKTGWSCTDNHNSKSIDKFIPTLLSWQLRSITGWDALDLFKPATAVEWNYENSSLRYAVLDTDESSSAATFFPRITSAAEIPKEVWNALGVSRLESLNAVQAALRLQRLLDSEREFASSIDTLVRRDGWQTLYAALLNPIITAVATHGEHLVTKREDSTNVLQFLTHLPVIGPADDDADTDLGWCAPSIAELLDADVCFYTSDERTWEDRIDALGDSEYEYLIRRPKRDIDNEAFKSFCKTLEAEKTSATRPRITVETTDADDAFQKALRDDVKYGMLAAAPGQPADIVNTYDTAVSLLKSYTADDQRWGFTEHEETETGIALENVRNSGAETYAPAYNADQVDELSELAPLFQSLFNGGQVDSYRLALSGGRVEGQDAVERELLKASIHELAQDIRLAVHLLAVDIDDDVNRATLQDALADHSHSVGDIRADLSARLASNSNSNSTSVTEALESPFDTITIRFARTNADDRLCSWVADRLRESNWSDPEPFVDTPLDAIPEWHILLLDRLAEQDEVSLDTCLPSTTARKQTHRFRSIVQAVADEQPLNIDNVAVQSLTDAEWAHFVQKEFPHDRLGEHIDDRCTWLHVAWTVEATPDSTFASQPLKHLLKKLFEATDAGDEDIKDDIRQFIETGPADARATSSGSEDSALVKKIRTVESSPTSLDGTVDSTSEFTAAERGTGGGYAGSLTDRPRVAELAVLRKVYAAMQDADLTYSDLREELEILHDDQHYWHTNAGWEDVYQQYRRDGKSLPDPEAPLSETLPGEAFDVTDERGPGYDILDPTGWVLSLGEDKTTSQHQATASDSEQVFTPVPIEVKSVSNLENPSFKFSVNQFRRALDFVPKNEDTEDGIPYVILLVGVSQDGEGYECQICRRIVLRRKEDVFGLLPFGDDELEGHARHLLERLVRGGSFIIS